MVSHILFALLHHDEQLTLDVICPLIILLFGAYFNNVYPDHEVDLWGVADGVFYVPLWRCACFLAIGMVMYHSQQAFYQLVHYQPDKQSRTWLYALAATLSWLLFLHTRNSAASYLPFMLFFMLSFTIHVPCLERLSLVRAGSALADKLSLMVFFNHALAIHLTKDLAGAYGWGNQDKITLLFIALTTALAIAGHVIVSHLIVQHRGQKARHAA